MNKSKSKELQTVLKKKCIDKYKLSIEKYYDETKDQIGVKLSVNRELNELLQALAIPTEETTDKISYREIEIGFTRLLVRRPLGSALNSFWGWMFTKDFLKTKSTTFYFDNVTQAETMIYLIKEKFAGFLEQCIYVLRPEKYEIVVNVSQKRE